MYVASLYITSHHGHLILAPLPKKEFLHISLQSLVILPSLAIRYLKMKKNFSNLKIIRGKFAPWENNLLYSKMGFQMSKNLSKLIIFANPVKYIIFSD